MRVLVVCTANVCRSVMAEAALRARLPTHVAVDSVGLIADGRSPDPVAIEAIASQGVEAVPRSSRRVTLSDLHAADLVLGLAVRHVRDVVVLDRRVFDRTFALAELVSLAQARGGRAPDEPLAACLARLHEGRTTAGLMVEPSPFDILDPTGGPRASYARTASHLVRLVDALAAALAF